MKSLQKPHIVANRLYRVWDLKSKDKTDILNALQEAYSSGLFDLESEYQKIFDKLRNKLC